MNEHVCGGSCFLYYGLSNLISEMPHKKSHILAVKSQTHIIG